MTPRNSKSQLSARTYIYTFFVVLLIVLACWFLLLRYGSQSEMTITTRLGTPNYDFDSGFPILHEKPIPHAEPFHDCPPEGDGGDSSLNIRKNRIDKATYHHVEFAALSSLPWPNGIDRKKRVDWTEAESKEVAKFEGSPISVNGYLLNVKEEGPESCNCGGTRHDEHDFHLWLANRPDDDRNESVVVEITPRIRAPHSAWTLKSLRKLIHDRTPVRVCGWLLLDPEHPDQVGKTRATIWEIHPVTQIYGLAKTGGYQTLTDLATGHIGISIDAPPADN